ncbi:RanBP1 domain-containing protein [Phlyctema vagabunda]|uniref:RanBP1 domain-containing protein n=1 Tax=Phlyctema vagabunda TaxID=108571 RepID=A0ABR4PUX7_9HELO
MSDLPQRANAAQLASRNIKMKPQRKKPLTAPAGAIQQQSFAPPSQSGLFGGSSSFNFSAGGPSISFSSPTPNNSFTSNTGKSFGSNASADVDDDDPRSHSIREELKRRNREFSNNDDDDAVPMFAPMPAEIAQNGPAVFNTGTQQSFSFGQNNTQPATSSIFNNPSSAQSSSSFSFGSTSTPIGGTTHNPFAPTSNAFGTTPLAQPGAPQNNTFGGFGQTAAQAAPTTNSPFSFGQPGSAAQQATSTSPFSFGQSAPPASSEPAKSSFSFGENSVPAAQPAQAFTFGSTSTSNPAPSNNLFGGSSAQPSPNIFAPASTARESSPNMFATTAPTTNTSIFGGASQSPAPQAPNTLGSHADTAPASTTSNIFGSASPSPAPQAPNALGSYAVTTPASTTPNIFGSVSQSPAPQAPDAAASTASNIFGSVSQGPAPQAPNTLGSHAVTTPALTASNTFGNIAPQIPNMLGSHTIAAPDTNSLSENASSQLTAASNMFGTAYGAPTSTTNNPGTLFGGSNSTQTSSTVFNNSFPQPYQPTPNLFGQTQQNMSSNNPLGLLNQPMNQQSQNNSSLFNHANSSSETGNYQAAAPQVSYNGSMTSLFAWHQAMYGKPLIAPGPGFDPNQVVGFKDYPPPNYRPINNPDRLRPFRNVGPQAIPIKHFTSALSEREYLELLRRQRESLRRSRANLFPLRCERGYLTENHAPFTPFHLRRERDHYGVLRNNYTPFHSLKPFKPLKIEKSDFKLLADAFKPPKHLSPGVKGLKKRNPSPAAQSTPDLVSSTDDAPSSVQPSSTSNTVAPTTSSNASQQLTEPSTSDKVLQSIEPQDVVDSLPTKNPASALEITEEYIDQFMPKGYTKSQKAQFYSGYRMRALNKAMERLFANLPLGQEISAIVDYYNEQREQVLSLSGRPFKSSKRKAVEEEDTNSSKRVRQGEPTSRSQITGLATSSPTLPEEVGRATSKQSNGGSGSPFAAQSLTAPQPAPPSSSPMKTQSYPNGSITPIAPAPSFGRATTSASPSKGKRKAEYQLTNLDPEGKAGERPAKTPRLDGSVGSETSNIFKNILDSPSEAPKSPEKSVGRLETLEKASQDVPRINPFASLATPGSSAKSSSQTETSTSSVSPSIFKPTVSPAKPTATPIKPPTFGVKPPSFGTAPVNFLAQFGQQAKKDEKDNEQKLMERAKEEDMDSDDDEVEWEATYKKKRQAELKKLEEFAKSKRATFVAGQGFTFDNSKQLTSAASAEAPRNESIKSSSNIAPTTSKSLFGQTPTPASSESIFSPAKRSRSSTPGGSVLDSHAPGKPVSFTGNIFGHLSNPGSPANGANDDESDADGESDSENKDPTYQPAEPGSEAASGPTTPVEKTGAGIASAKKMASATPFSFGSTTQPSKSVFGPPATSSTGLFGTATTPSSAASTQGGSLFDRISKDSNGNPMRQVPTEEKENTKPHVGNVFGSSNGIFGGSQNSASPSKSTEEDISKSTPEKSLFGQPDKTWKPDSPIRFGSTAPNGASTTAPAVSVTDATPTKPGPFAGLFGNSTSKPAASISGGLFGNSTTPKTAPPTAPGVGFAFGGPSSTTSSLFPSAAVSASTSRATSPGQTTDGESAVEGSNDPDAEKHEQIDLTKGGPGEEDEELLHEVRAKALKYTPSEDKNPWVTKGLGPLRVLKHKETKASRVLLRADPSGTIVLNKGILAGVEFAANGKTLKFLAASDSAGSLETWMLQVKTPEFATELAKVLEANKSSS